MWMVRDYTPGTDTSSFDPDSSQIKSVIVLDGVLLLEILSRLMLMVQQEVNVQWQS